MEREALTETLRETLAQFDSSGEPRTTPEVAEALGLGRRSTYNRLDRLAERGRLKTKKVGANARVWWRPPPTAPDDPDWSAAAESLVDDVLDDVEVSMFVLDENFDVAWINEATERYFGLDRADAVGRDKRLLVDEHIRTVVDDSERFAETVLATYDDNTDTERFECHVLAGEDREERWLEHRSRPIETGAYAGGRVELYYDVTDRKRTTLAHQRDREQFESLVSAVEEYAIVTLDPDGYVRTWNPGVERIHGYEADDVLGEHVSIFHTEAAREAGDPERNLAVAADEGSLREEGWRVREDGSRFWATVTLTPIRDEAGNLQGYAKVVRDMSGQRERERQLRQERDLTEQLLDVAPVRLAVFRADGSIERMNAEAMRALDLDEEALSDFQVGDLDVRDADGTPIPLPDHPVSRVLETGERVSDRLVQHEGAAGHRWLSLTAAPLRDEDGTIERVVVAGRDVTDLKRQEGQLERRRDELRSELDDVFTRIDDAFYALDDDLRFTYVNDRAAELLGRAEGDLLGRTVWEALSVPDDDPIRDRFETAMATQEPASFERYSGPLGIWETVRIYPSESGLSVYFRDITERKERERELERYETVVETVEDGVYVVDSDARFVMVNDAFCEMTGWSRAELIGRQATTVHDDDVTPRAERLMAEIERGERETATIELELQTKSGDRIPVESRISPFRFEGASCRCGVVRDVSERTARERELEEYRRWTQTLVENYPGGALALVDADFRYVTFGGSPEGDTSVTGADLEGRPVREVLPEQLAEVVVPGYEAALDGESSRFVDEIDGRSYEFHFVPVRDEDGEVFAATAMSRDVTEQRDREEMLREAKAQLEAATEAGAVGTWEWNIRDDEFVAGASFARTFGLDPDAARAGVSIDRLLDAIHEDDRERVERSIEEAVSFCGTYREEYRVRDANDDRRWVVARGQVECDGAGEPVTFPGALVDITERKEAEARLERQREQLAALNGLNEVVRDITTAVIEQSTREEIEATVCERLAATESYQFAWIGAVDPDSQTVAVRTEAGTDGYLDGVTISVDPDDARSEGPTGRALKTGKTQVTQDMGSDARHDPWRDRVDAYDVQSSAAIPIVHEGTTYGVLNLYADRPAAFEGQEREVVSQLGEVVGHAITAAERKRALLSDQLVELDFRIQDVLGPLDTGVEPSGRVTLDHAVPTGDGEFLVYGTATPDALDTVHALVDVNPHWDSVTVLSEDDRLSFEIRAIDPPVLSLIASRGGYVDEAVVEDGDYRMTVHLAPSVDVREITDAVEAAHPGAELLRRRQISRSRDDPGHLQRRLVTELTDRQRTVLEAAYHSGYFEWPRERTGERIAESLDLAPPTFHNHLRKAERKALDALLSQSNPTEAP